MNGKKVIAVVGATGAQGGGLARAILDEPESGFALRALTRNVDSDNARALAGRGAEVVHADLDDEESLVRALDGAYGAFFVTNFWEHFSPEREGAQARNLAQAAKRAGVRHVVWSTLEDTRERVPLDDDRMPTLMGRYKVPHFDAKGESDAAFRELGVPTTFLRTAFYWDNFIGFGMGPRRGDDGVLSLALPMGDKRLSGIAAEDIGRCAYGVFKAGPEMIGRTVGIAGDHLTGEEMAATLGRALGEEVRYQDVPVDVYRSLGFPGAEDLGNMFQYYQEFADEFAASRPVDGSRALNPALQSFEQWAARNASRIPIAG
ncbi:MAG TPA: NmrA/HSCARG family protein [Longimicrobiaceae bacterium]|nr:NmrA/HSCARG family protein [Longimicrobiaceae bacterium]